MNLSTFTALPCCNSVIVAFFLVIPLSICPMNNYIVYYVTICYCFNITENNAGSGFNSTKHYFVFSKNSLKSWKKKITPFFLRMVRR